MQAVVVKTGYPPLFQPFLQFDGEPGDYAKIISFYAGVSNDIHAAGMKMIVESSAIFPGLVTIFGSGLAAANGAATVTVTDSAGAAQAASTVCVSPPQINAVLPGGLASGAASFSVVPAGGGAAVTGSFTVAPVAPGIFSADASGTGVAAAETLTLHADGSMTNDVVFTCAAAGVCVPKPISVSTPGDTVYLILFGTGIRNRSSLATTSLVMGTKTVAPLFAGAQGGFAGLDQINALIPATLAGAGTVTLAVNADGLSRTR